MECPKYDVAPWNYESPRGNYSAIPGFDEKLVETAGFVPLDVRFKMMEQAGFRAQFKAEEFDSMQMRDIYLKHPEFTITPDDEYEDIMLKMELQRAYVNDLKVKARAQVSQPVEKPAVKNEESVGSES